MRIFTIYERPLDYPIGYVVRGSTVGSGGDIVVDSEAGYASTLGGARALVPLGLIRIERSPGDDPVIKEVWL